MWFPQLHDQSEKMSADTRPFKRKKSYFQINTKIILKKSLLNVYLDNNGEWSRCVGDDVDGDEMSVKNYLKKS